MNARFSPLVREARGVIRKVMGIEAAPLYIRRVFGNEIHLTYALGRAFILDFTGVPDREREDGVRLVPTRFATTLASEHAPKGGWAKWLTSKSLPSDLAAHNSSFDVRGTNEVAKLL